MDKLKREKLSSFLVKFGSILVAFYVVFLIGKSVWTNYNLHQSIEKLQKQIVHLEEQKKELSNLNLYYQSDSFKELEARRKLGMKKADEKVVIVSNTPGMNFQESILSAETNVAQNKKTKSPNWSLWLDFFFNK